MSGRGGGRGGWRGRGRGAAGGPVARDDEGKPLEVEQSGPPKLYPDLPSLPSKPELSSKDERLLTRRHLLLDYYRSLFSPYYLEFQVSRNESVEEQIRKYNGAQEVKQKPKRPKLTQVLSLEPRYFPAELYSSVQQRYVQVTFGGIRTKPCLLKSNVDLTCRRSSCGCSSPTQSYQPFEL
mmetsp:Transcript_26179/g.62262  ORF Transcript_26179/g.62262 Transcript_26179/m.62262 type:complete len:180 (+) Transcript_26179:81-620(+)